MSAPRFTTAAFATTEEQLLIQTATERSLLVEAAAGAKTTSLALRMAESLAHGTAPRRILALTFTDTACTALRRALRLIGVPEEAAQQLRIETFESFAAARLRTIEQIEGRDPVQRLATAEALKAEVWRAVEAAAASRFEHHRDELNLPAFGSNAFVGQFLRDSRALKGRLLLERQEEADDLDFAEEHGIDYTLLRVLHSFESLRRLSGHEHPRFRGPFDACYDLARALQGEEADLPVLPRNFIDELFVDEMHDCNEAMFTILKALLREPEIFFCAVGDRDQVIHQAHGADARFLGPDLDRETGRSMRRLPLSKSFRYGSDIASWMARHAAKPIRAHEGLQTEIQRASYAEGRGEDALITALQAWRRDERGPASYEGCAVLLRHESQSVLLENAMHAAGIAYQCAGFASYLHRPEVLFVRSVYAIASGRLDTLGGAATRQRIPEALFTMTQTPPRAEDDPDYASNEDFLREAAKHAAASEAVVERIFSEHLMNRAPRGVRARLQAAVEAARRPGSSFEDFIAALDMPRFALEVFVDAPRRRELGRHMAGLVAAAQRFPSVLAFFSHLQAQDEEQAQRLQDRAAGKVRSAKARVPAVTLASVAHVKGLEFEHVLLPFLERGVFPDAGSVAADERNLFYVAVTRAKRRLSLLAHAERPSGFLSIPNA